MRYHKCRVKWEGVRIRNNKQDYISAIQLLYSDGFEGRLIELDDDRETPIQEFRTKPGQELGLYTFIHELRPTDQSPLAIVELHHKLHLSTGELLVAWKTLAYC